jgi:hypothetical protein
MKKEIIYKDSKNRNRDYFINMVFFNRKGRKDIAQRSQSVR